MTTIIIKISTRTPSKPLGDTIISSAETSVSSVYVPIFVKLELDSKHIYLCPQGLPPLLDSFQFCHVVLGQIICKCCDSEMKVSYLLV